MYGWNKTLPCLRRFHTPILVLLVWCLFFSWRGLFMRVPTVAGERVRCVYFVATCTLPTWLRWFLFTKKLVNSLTLYQHFNKLSFSRLHIHGDLFVMYLDWDLYHFNRYFLFHNLGCIISFDYRFNCCLFCNGSILIVCVY